jgi:hypothetical protein
MLFILVGCAGLSMLALVLLISFLTWSVHGDVVPFDLISLHGMIALENCGPRWESLDRLSECRAASMSALGLSGSDGPVPSALRWLSDIWMGGWASLLALLLLRLDQPRRRARRIGPDDVDALPEGKKPFAAARRIANPAPSRVLGGRNYARSTY